MAEMVDASGLVSLVVCWLVSCRVDGRGLSVLSATLRTSSGRRSCFDSGKRHSKSALRQQAAWTRHG